MTDEFDVIVVGGGPAGEHAVGRCSSHGLQTVLVERELVGGECSYWACMPSKTLLRPGQVLAAARNVPGAREAVTGQIDAAATLGRRNWMTADWNDKGQADWVAGTGATLIRGHARLTGERSVEVESGDGTRTALRARKAVILATGSSAAVPPIGGLRDTRFWDNRGATAAQQVPGSLLVLGGGPVGVELAQAWKRLGTHEVIIVEAAERLLSREEPFAGEQLSRALSEEGITVLTGARVASVERADGDGPVTATLEDGRTLSAGEILVAVGRQPRTTDLGLEHVGLEGGKSIAVGDTMLAEGVDGDWLYAIGDINGRALLTHMGKYQARIAVDMILGRDVVDVADEFGVPRIVFTDPQVASVGLTESQAIEKGHAVRVVSTEISKTPAGEIAGEKVVGSCQLVVDTSNDLIIGATFVGADVSELLHSATVAIIGRVPMAQLRHAVASFPSLSEVWLALVDSYDPAPYDSRAARSR